MIGFQLLNKRPNTYIEWFKISQQNSITVEQLGKLQVVTEFVIVTSHSSILVKTGLCFIVQIISFLVVIMIAIFLSITFHRFCSKVLQLNVTLVLIHRVIL